MPVSLSAWWLLGLALPVLLLGEWMDRRFRVFHRYNIPVPVLGGLALCLLIVVLDAVGLPALSFRTRVDAAWWTWLVTPEAEWAARPEKPVSQPFLIGFFTCIGLNATWLIVRRGSWQVPLFLALATVLAILQNALGVGLAKLMGENPLLGLICGSITQTGGHGTALGFAETLRNAGFESAATIGAAAATFGLVFGSLIGGPIAGWLIRRHRLRAESSAESSGPADDSARAPGILQITRELGGYGIRSVIFHLLLLAALIKIGAWASWAIERAGLLFPSYMGALVVGLILRNGLDLAGFRRIDSRVVDHLGAILLGLFLAIAMASLNLRELAAGAVPMLVILFAQVLLVSLFTALVTFRLMGRDYEAAVMVSGHCGFAHGATPNAIANMQSVSRRFGPAPRAFIVIPIVGAMLIDVTNSINITWFLNHLRG
jgi:ESS family glutamate:Na+ symporter